MSESTTFVIKYSPIKRWCVTKGEYCEWANDNGHCKVTGCLKEPR